MTSRGLGRLREALLYTEGRMSEWIVGLVGLGFGLILLDPAYDSFHSSSSYRIMAAYANENVWGALMLGAVLLNTVGQPWGHLPRWVKALLARVPGLAWLIERGAFWLRWVGIVGEAVLFAVIGTQLFLAQPAATGWWTYSALGMAAGLTALRLVVLRSIAGPGGTHDP